MNNATIFLWGFIAGVAVMAVMVQFLLSAIKREVREITRLLELKRKILEDWERERNGNVDET